MNYFLEIFNTKIPITKAFRKFEQNYEMQRLIFIISILFFLLTSCAKQKPKGILEEDKMTELMTEVSLIDGYLNTLPIDSGKRVMPVLYENLFNQFQIDSTIFLQNLHFYLGNPKLTEQIYTKVGDNLKTYENDYRIEDSVRNVFMQDSLRRVSRIQTEVSIMKNLILNFQMDSTEFKYLENANHFYNKLHLQMNVYGVQTPIIASPQVSPTAETLPTEVSVEELKPVEESVVEEVIPSIDTLRQAPLRNNKMLLKPERIRSN